MLTVQDRLREIATARVKAYAGKSPEPKFPAAQPAVIQFPLRKNGKTALPVYLLADALLRLPPDAMLIAVHEADYGLQVALLVESQEFPVIDSSMEEIPYFDLEIKREFDGNTSRITGMTLGELHF